MPDAGQTLLTAIPLDAALVLEIGCGAGALGQAYRRRNPRAFYAGVEPRPKEAKAAVAALNAVVAGDIADAATLDRLDTVRGGHGFDALVFDGTLTRLAEPARTLAALRARARPDAVCVVRLTESPAQPRLSAGALALFRDSGWTICDAKPALPDPDRDTSAGRSWIVRAANGPAPTPLFLNAATPRRFAGITEARTEDPLEALGSRPGLWIRWEPENVRIVGAPPGLLLFQRMLLDDDRIWDFVQQKIAQGWTTVSDIDDDPRHFDAYVQTDFRAFRGVHALTVSTGPLADLMRPMNPNLAVLPNAVAALPDPPPPTPKSGRRLRLFFGAINRGDDWAPMMAALAPALAALGDRIEVLVIHDRAFFDALPDNTPRRFHRTLPYDQYKAALLTCDIALLPLADTAFNRNKSDIKLIECCAAGVVPICSPTVYADDPRNAAVSVMVDRPEGFADALTALCRDLPRLAHLRAAGRAYVATERMHAYQVREREAFYRRVVENRDTLEAQRRDRMTQSGG